MKANTYRTMDGAWLDAQYDNRARVFDAQAQIERWGQASALVREQSRCVLDLPYGDGAGETLDVFEPDPGREPAPVLVFLHGGYWRSLDKADHSFVSPGFVADGAMVVVPNYALCPGVGIEHIMLQLTRAIAWVWRHAGEHGGDPSRIALVGHSVGAHAAAMLLSCRWKMVDPALPDQPLRGALALSGLYDLEPLRHTSFLQPDLKLTPQSVARLSPAFFPRPKVPLYAVVGADESEEYLRQNKLIRDCWGPSRVPVCETLPWADHFSIMTSLVDPAGRLHDLALRLVGLR